MRLALFTTAVLGSASSERVAVCVTGKVQTALAPPVLTAYRAKVLAPLKEEGFHVDLFLALTGAKDAGDALSSRLSKAYPDARAVLLVPTHTVQPKKCALESRPQRLGGKSLKGFAPRSIATPMERERIRTQLQATRRAYEAVLAREEATGRPYDWVLRIRSDVVVLTSLSLKGRAALPHVPHGEIWTSPLQSCLTDHIFACPRGACRPYFTALELWESSHCEPEASGEPLASRLDLVPDGRAGPPTAPFKLPAAPPGVDATLMALLRYGGAKCVGTDGSLLADQTCCGGVWIKAHWQYGLVRGNSTHGTVQLDRYFPLS